MGEAILDSDPSSGQLTAQGLGSLGSVATSTRAQHDWQDKLLH